MNKQKIDWATYLPDEDDDEHVELLVYSYRRCRLLIASLLIATVGHATWVILLLVGLYPPPNNM